MQFAIFMPARVDAWPIIKRGEELGFTHAWLYDSQMIYPDTFACLALCAEHTTRIKLGQGVTNPASRIAPLMASALGTINQMAPGRVLLGIGTGNTTRRAMGLPPVRLDYMAEYIRVVRSLMRGEMVEYTEGKRTQLIQMIHREGSIDPTFMNFRDPVPIVVSALGPRARAIAGELGDEVMITGQPTAQDVAQIREEMRPGAEKTGRRVEDIPIVLMARIYVMEPGEQFGSDRMRASIGGLMQSGVGVNAARVRAGRAGFDRITDDEILPHMSPLVEEYRKLRADVKGPGRLDGPAWYVTAYDGHAWKMHPKLLPVLTEEALRAGTLIGTADQVLRRIKEWESMGITQVGPMFADSVENVSVTMERFGEEIVRRY